MKTFTQWTLLALAIAALPLASSAQINEGDGLNFPGAWNGWANPPAQTWLQFEQRDIGPTGSQWITTMNVQASGGDLTAGTYDHKITAPGFGDPWQNQWTVYTNAVANSIVTMDFGDNGNSSVILDNGFHYTFVWEDNGYNGTSMAILRTTNAPIDILGATDNTLTPTITLSAAKSADERVLVRYTTDTWVSSAVVEATGSGTTYNATIPDPGPGVAVQFYILTTSITDDAAFLARPDLQTLRLDDNGGGNYLFGVLPPEATITADPAGPTNANAITYTVVFDKDVDGVDANAFTLFADGTATGTLGAPVGADGQTTFTLEVTGVTGDGTLRLDLTNGSAIFDTDTSSKAALPTSGSTVVIDNTAPTVDLLTPINPTEASEATLKMQFSEAMNGADAFEVGDLQIVGNGSLANFRQLNDHVFLVDVALNADGDVTVTVPASVATDAAGNPNGANAITLTRNSALSDPENLYEGFAIYAAGETPPLYNFMPGVDPLLQLRDDGTHGDANAGDGLWSVTFTPPVGDGEAIRRWKVGDGIGFPNVNLPNNADAFSRPTAGVPHTYYLQTVAQNDGFMPDVSATLDSFTYTSPSVVAPGDTVRMTGSFISELNGGTDWDATNPGTVLFDNGTSGGDVTAGDGLYTIRLTGIPSGSYEYKITVNGGFNPSVGELGWTTSGNNLDLSVLSATDTLTVTFDALRGRVKIENDNPLAQQGPPFFATSPEWGEALDATTMLYDDGTNGDVLAGDGIYSREFNVVSRDTNVKRLRVRQGAGDPFPKNGDYPFFAGFGSNVLVQFDTNTYNDGYTPSAYFVFVNPAARRVPSYVQAVGNLMDELGADGDWQNGNTQFELLDSGTGGDVVAGDQVFAKSFLNLDGLTNLEWKGLGLQGSWDYQYGGEGEGATVNGDNIPMPLTVGAGTPAIFQVDIKTGRIGVGSGLPTRPATIDAQASPSAVSGARQWSLYQ